MPLESRLKKCDFYKNLSSNLQKKVFALLDMELTNRQDDIKSIDIDKGYDTMKDDECFILALNSIGPLDRKHLQMRLRGLIKTDKAGLA